MQNKRRDKIPAPLRPKTNAEKSLAMAERLARHPHIVQLAEDLHRDWEQHLKPRGVKWPGPSQIAVLLFLFEAKGEPRTQDEIEEWFRQFELGQYNKQIRHVSALGWFIKTGNSRGSRMQIEDGLKSNQVCLASTTLSNPLHAPERKITISSASWKQLLEMFAENNRGCAVCGTHKSSYDKGHLDPTKAGDDGNIVPMCSDCNNWGAARDMTFELDSRNLIARPKIKAKSKKKVS
jgi:hypothetical protein